MDCKHELIVGKDSPEKVWVTVPPILCPSCREFVTRAVVDKQGKVK